MPKPLAEDIEWRLANKVLILVCGRTRFWEWESFPRRKPKPARESGPVGVINNRIGQWFKSD